MSRAVADAILFDLDGTLVDTAPTISAALNQLRAGRGLLDLTPDIVRPWISLGVDDLVRRGVGGKPLDDDVASFRSTLAALPTSRESLYPGCEKLLFDLRSCGRHLAIVSNKPERLCRKVLQDLGLTNLFGSIVGGDTAKFCKPDPAPLLTALAELGLCAQTAVFVGDSDLDAKAAMALRIPFYLFEGGYGASEVDSASVAGRFLRHDQLRSMLLLPSRRKAQA